MRPRFLCFALSSLCLVSASPADAQELPPPHHVALHATPPGTIILLGGRELAPPAKIVIPKGECVTVEASQEGFVPVKKSFCYQEGLPEPPATATLALVERLLTISVAPEDAAFEIDGQAAANSGQQELLIALGSCRDISVRRSGYVSWRRQICYEEQGVFPPSFVHLDLKEDEAYTQSVDGLPTNQNLELEGAAGLTFEEAWKRITLAVLETFDILEVTEKDLGYLRTGWRATRFAGSTVRSRVIVKQTGRDPVRFSFRLDSAHGDGAETPVLDDASFKPWGRLLPDDAALVRGISERLLTPPRSVPDVATEQPPADAIAEQAVIVAQAAIAARVDPLAPAAGVWRFFPIRFEDEETDGDPLELTRRLNESLREISKFELVEPESLTEAYRVEGSYREGGGRLTIQMQVLLGDRRMTFDTSLAADPPEAVVAEILRRLEAHLRLAKFRD